MADRSTAVSGFCQIVVAAIGDSQPSEHTVVGEDKEVHTRSVGPRSRPDGPPEPEAGFEDEGKPQPEAQATAHS